MNIIDPIERLAARFRARDRRDEPPEPAQNDWSVALRGMADRLKGLTTSTEQEFLHIGEKLQDFYSRSQNMSEISSSVVDLMTGEEMLRSSQQLSQILGELQDHLRESDQHFSTISDILSQYMDTLRKVISRLDDFKTLVLNLNMLGFLTRVENAHVFSDDTGFASLTDDVRKLSKRIDEKSSHIRQRSQDLLKLIHTASRDVSASEKSQRDQTQLILENTISNHKLLEQKNDSATVSARLITERTRAITQSIGDIVSSLQFHDITRQQVEHVHEILDNLASTVCNEKHTLPEQASIISEVCSLQNDQLTESHKEFATAVDRIIQNLTELTDGVKEILEETHKVALASDDDGTSFMDEIDSGITTVIRCLDENIREQMHLSQTMATVSEMVSEMSLFIQEIEYMGQNLQLIALNARIKAAHMGGEGAALDTISGGIYDLSKNSRTDTRTLADMLARISDMAKGFDTDLADMQRTQKEQVQAVVDNLKEIIASLHRINERVLSITTDMNIRGESLMNDIRDTARSITVQDKVQNILEQTQGSMEQMISETSGMVPEQQSGETKTYLENFDQLYTMESEREVHMHHMDKEQETGTEGTAANNSGDDLGDNVELF